MTEITEINNESVETDNYELTASDRCDICDAQAYVRVEMAIGDLMFCAHHANEKRAELEPLAVSWHDETAKLTVR
ncbi:MAG: hypothetical protein RLZZ359_203 [Actinomycetota bacterium]|jgi:hypothetical protein